MASTLKAAEWILLLSNMHLNQFMCQARNYHTLGILSVNKFWREKFYVEFFASRQQRQNSREAACFMLELKFEWKFV